MFSSIVLNILDVFFPRECLICNAPGNELCQKCALSLSWPKPKGRNRQWMTSIWNYRDNRVQQIIITLKNKPHARLAQICANHFVKQILNQPKTHTDWMLVPVPISASRRRERGYNQSELLAVAYQQALRTQLVTKSSQNKLIGTLFPICKQALAKQRITIKQGTTKSREDRLENMHNVFIVSNPIHVRNKNIIIIDDVTTTGATLADAKRALLEAGALKVLAWTVAN